MIIEEDSEKKYLENRGFYKDKIYFNSMNERVKIECVVDINDNILVDNLDNNNIEYINLNELKREL